MVQAKWIRLNTFYLAIYGKYIKCNQLKAYKVALGMYYKYNVA